MIALLELLRTLILYALMVPVPLSYNLTLIDKSLSVNHFSEYAFSSVSNCTVSILKLKLTKYTVPRETVVIFVSPQMMGSQRSLLANTVDQLLRNGYAVNLIKLKCPDYPHIGDPKLKSFLSKMVDGGICYGWGPEAFYCNYTNASIKIEEAPMGSYEFFISRNIVSNGTGTEMAINFLLKIGKLRKLGVSDWIYVNSKRVALGSLSMPLLLSQDMVSFISSLNLASSGFR